jgi:hypothetical protein
MNIKFIAIPAIALAAGIGLAACGSSGPSTAAVHGSFDYSGLTGGSGSCTAAGAQVKITDGSGNILATPTLPASPVSKTITASGVQVPVQEYTYSAVVPVESRYAVTLGSLAPYYVTEAQFIKGLDLSCS